MGDAIGVPSGYASSATSEATSAGIPVTDDETREGGTGLCVSGESRRVRDAAIESRASATTR